MKQYLELLEDVLDNGVEKIDRTGVGIKSVFGRQVRYDLSKGFPLLTSKKMFTKGIVYELLWFLKGDTNIKYLNDNGVHIWDAWADENGDLGPVYSAQWRKWKSYGRVNIDTPPPKTFGGKYIYKYEFPFMSDVLKNTIDVNYMTTIDQISNVIESIKQNPDSRRHVVSAWNVAEIDDMALPPCHMLFQFYVQDNKLSCMLTMRSNDLFLGAPFNIAQYSLLTHMIAQVCGLEVGEFIHSIGDAHIYLNHIDQVKLQLSRKNQLYDLCNLKLNSEIKNIDDFKFEDIVFENYKSHSTIKGEVAI